MPFLSRCLLIAALVLLSACSPKYNWREAHGGTIQFTVLLPAKPATFSRQIDLNGLPVTMTMTAAEIDGVTFAVGAAELPDAERAGKALDSMQTALVNNISGNLKEAHIAGKQTNVDRVLDIAADGVSRGQPLLLQARLIAKGSRIYQVLIIGNPKDVSAENAETFFTSFKPT
ncbi:hypothetical protein [Herbaspirillum autotrophicum]|uniref:hypothetical protein n=1 Tax=Herbaspirillum autotrophicum TaxID=180195 RepID=UPI00067D4EE7|nr:hypothetical protein [Herbaspirillum autotrophicum]